MLKRTLYFLHRFLLPHIALFGIVILTGFVAASASGLGIPVMVKYVFPVLFDSATESGTPELFTLFPGLTEYPRNTLLIMAALAMPILFAIRGVSQWLNAVMVNVLGIRILEDLRMAVFDRLQELPLSYVDGSRKGDIVSRVVTDTSNVQNVLGKVANDLIKQPLTALSAMGAFIFMLFSHSGSWVFAACMLLLGLAIWPVVEFGRRVAVKSRRAQEAMGDLNSVLQQNLEAQREVRAYGLEEQQIRSFAEATDHYNANVIKQVKYQKALVPIVEVVTALSLSVLLVSARSSNVDLQTFLAIAASLFFCFDSLRRTGIAYNSFNSAQGSLSRLEEVLREPNPMPEPVEPKHFAGPVRGEIELCGVNFFYDEQHPALQEVNLRIPAGQIVGLVGPSGAGKTTFACLIPRFYDPTEGCVKIDGIDIRDLTYHELREQIALVGQQALLFAGSIRDNIALGKTGATQAEIEHAADAARVSVFLDGEKTLDTELGQGGTGLSGGQRQRVAIARAFVKDAPILILDEATASLDAESEHEIQEQLDSLAKGRTTLIVAHRFSTIRNAHRILVFDRGRIIADGPHEVLYAQCPLYRELYDRQGMENRD